jgi:hypothetical protein
VKEADMKMLQTVRAHVTATDPDLESRLRQAVLHAILDTARAWWAEQPRNPDDVLLNAEWNPLDGVVTLTVGEPTR